MLVQSFITKRQVGTQGEVIDSSMDSARGRGGVDNYDEKYNIVYCTTVVCSQDFPAFDVQIIPWSCLHGRHDSQRTCSRVAVYAMTALCAVHRTLRIDVVSCVPSLAP